MADALRHVDIKGDFQLLVVENDPTYLHLITQILGDSYRLLVAKSTAKALDLLNRNRIHILLISVNLPDNAGLDFCKQIKSERKKYGDINIVLMSNGSSPEVQLNGLKLGASDYIVKPFDGLALLTRIKLQGKLLRRAHLLEQLALLDELTEIPNRQAFDNQLPEVWSRAQQARSYLSLVFVDIDYFKQFNDSYGHLAGDELLSQLAQCFVDSFKRESDFYARYNNEQFAVLLFGCELADAVACIENLLEKFRQLDIKHEHSEAADVATCSAGVCTANPGTEDMAQLVPATTKMLQQAKTNGRARVVGGQLSESSYTNSGK